MNSKNSLAINFINISKRFGDIIALNNVTFHVNKGEVFGYLGPNGAGKTTTIRILLGLIKPSRGYYQILDEQGDLLPSEKIGFVLESDGLFDRLTAYQNLFFYGKIYKVKEIEKRIFESLRIVSIPDTNKPVGTFSKGMKKRLALARAILHEPQILILDEPTAGLDPLGQIEIQKIISNLSKEKNITIFLTSHNLDEVKKICDSVAILYKGELKFQGKIKDIVEGNKSLEELYISYVKDSQ